MLPEELEKLHNLHERGALSDGEFQDAKQRLLAAERSSSSNDLLGLDMNNYRALMHGSQYAGFIVPFAGLVAPIVLWAMAKDNYPEVDIEGKKILNWMISEFIYIMISGLLCLILIGIPLLVIAILAGFILPLIGTIQASQGRSYRYPCTIEFLK